MDAKVLILHGDKDIQVDVDDARLLQKARPDARLVIIEEMNHVLKSCKTLDKMTQFTTTYNNAELPNVKMAADEVVTFVRKL